MSTPKVECRACGGTGKRYAPPIHSSLFRMLIVYEQLCYRCGGHGSHDPVKPPTPRPPAPKGRHPRHH